VYKGNNTGKVKAEEKYKQLIGKYKGKENI
jgi:hypothetical protein